MSNWTPLYDKMIVRRRPEQTEIAGLEVPVQAREKQNVGTVEQIGAGRLVTPYEGDNGQVAFLAPLTITVGDEVLFNKFAGMPLEGDDPDLVVLREDEILAYRKADV